jgi:diacylglycerol kinase
MNVPAHSAQNDLPLSPGQLRRPAWRRRFVDLERGLARGFRASAAITIHFFCGLIGLMAGLVLGLSAWDWAVLLMCFSMSLGSELMHHAVTLLCRSTMHGRDEARHAHSVSAAAATLIMCGSILAALVLLGARALAVWQD